MKTEEPTPRRLRRALEEGDSGASVFASQAVALVVAAALMPIAVKAAAGRVGERLTEAIRAASQPSPGASFDAARAAMDVVALSAPVLVGVAIAAAAGSIVQTGGFVGGRRLAPRFDRLNPFQGIRGLVTRARLLAVARSLAGAAIVGWLVVHELRAHAVDLVRTSGRLAYAAPTAGAIAKTIAWNAAAAGLALAAIDVALLRLDRRRRLRMSSEEVKREQKEAEGDPRAKQARERAHAEASAQGAIAEVARASVVLVGREGAACALRYVDGEARGVPVVLAIGRGEEAERIARIARESGVPVVREVGLAEALVEVAVGEAIPEAHYEAVAAILRQIWDESS